MKILGNTSGLVVPVFMIYYLCGFATGGFTAEGDCYSIEHPDYKQYSQDPT